MPGLHRAGPGWQVDWQDEVIIDQSMLAGRRFRDRRQELLDLPIGEPKQFRQGHDPVVAAAPPAVAYLPVQPEAEMEVPVTAERTMHLHMARCGVVVLGRVRDVVLVQQLDQVHVLLYC